MTNLALLLVQMAALQAHMDAVAQAIREELGITAGPEPGSCQQCGASADRGCVDDWPEGVALHRVRRGVGTVNPETVHFVAQMIRHMRAMALSADRWVRSRDFSRDEALDGVHTFRRVLDSYEAQLSRVEIRTEEDIRS